MKSMYVCINNFAWNFLGVDVMGVAYVGGASSYDCHELLVTHSLLSSFQELQVLLIVLNGSLVPQESHQSYTAPEI